MLDLSLVTFTARAQAKKINKKKNAPQERQSCWEYNKNSDSVERADVFIDIPQQV